MSFFFNFCAPLGEALPDDVHVPGLVGLLVGVPQAGLPHVASLLLSRVSGDKEEKKLKKSVKKKTQHIQDFRQPYDKKSLLFKRRTRPLDPDTRGPGHPGSPGVEGQAVWRVGGEEAPADVALDPLPGRARAAGGRRQRGRRRRRRRPGARGGGGDAGAGAAGARLLSGPQAPGVQA